jgi:transposase
VVNAIFYIAQSGCHWRMLPREFPPFTTIQYYFYRWRDDGTWCRINHALVMQARELEGREASPSAGVIDSQSVKTTEAAGPRGYDAGKNISGRKRHLLVDKIGLVIAAIVHRADIQDRDGTPLLLATMRSAFPWLRHIFADGGYAGEKLHGSIATAASPRTSRLPSRAHGLGSLSPASSCSPAGLPGNSPTPPDYESDSKRSSAAR